MVFKCKALCESREWLNQFNTTKILRNAYINGYKRCSICVLFIKNHNRCPCCHTILSSNPKNSKSKRLITDTLGRY